MIIRILTELCGSWQSYWIKKGGGWDYDNAISEKDPRYKLSKYFAVVVRGLNQADKKLSGSPTEIIVPPGFCSDGASIPIGRRFDRYVWAAVIHDWLYFSGLYSRIVADTIFLSMMLLNPAISLLGAYAYYYGVRAGAWRAWNRHRALDDNKRKAELIRESNAIKHRRERFVV